jgi:hypothetical protein
MRLNKENIPEENALGRRHALIPLGTTQPERNGIRCSPPEYSWYSPDLRLWYKILHLIPQYRKLINYFKIIQKMLSKTFL